MSKSAKQIVADNLDRLMKARPDLESTPKIGARGIVSQRTAARAVNQGNLTLDKLEGLARTFKLKPWQLLVPDLDPFALPSLHPPSDETESTLSPREREIIHTYRNPADESIKQALDSAVRLQAKLLQLGEAGNESTKPDAPPKKGASE